MQYFVVVVVLIASVFYSVGVGAFPAKITDNGVFLSCCMQHSCGYCKFDTGTTKNFVMPGVVTGGKTVGQACFAGDAGQKICSKMVKVRKVQINGKKFRNVVFIEHSIDLYSFLDMPVIGIIGLETLGDSGILIDLMNKNVEMVENVVADPTAITYDYKLVKGKIFIDEMIAGEGISALFDIGASMSVVNKRYYDKRRGFFEKVGSVNAMDGTGKVQKTPIVKCEWALFSGMSEKGGRLLVLDYVVPETAIGHKIDLVVGADMLRDRRVLIDPKNKRISIK